MSASLSSSAAAAADDLHSDSESASDSLNPDNDEGWEDVEPEDDSQPVVGLFNEEVYPDVRSMLKESRERYNFDLVKVQKSLGV